MADNSKLLKEAHELGIQTTRYNMDSESDVKNLTDRVKDRKAEIKAVSGGQPELTADDSAEASDSGPMTSKASKRK